MASFRLLAAKLSWNFNQFQAFRRQLAQTFACSIATSSNLITPKEILYSPASCFCPFRIEIGKNGNLTAPPHIKKSKFFIRPSPARETRSKMRYSLYYKKRVHDGSKAPMHTCRPQGATLRKVRSLILRQYRFHRYFLRNKKVATPRLCDS